MKHAGRPGDADARVEVPVVSVIESRISGAGLSVDGGGEWAVGGTGPKTGAMKRVEIEDRGTIVRLVRHSVIFPAQPQVQREIRSHLPFVLKIGHVEGAPKFMAAPRSS